MVRSVAGGVAPRRVSLLDLEYADPAENERIREVLQHFHTRRG